MEPVFAVDEVRYRPDEPRERVFMGRSLDAIKMYRPQATNDDEATFSDLRQIDLPWYEIFTRIASTPNDAPEWTRSIQEYFDHPGTEYSDDAVLLYVSEVDTPKLF